jgi:hypothetical protein
VQQLTVGQSIRLGELQEQGWCFFGIARTDHEDADGGERDEAADKINKLLDSKKKQRQIVTRSVDCA